MFGQLLPVTERLLQFAEILRLTQLLIVQVGISPFDAVLVGKQPFYSAAGGVHTFSTAGLDILLPFLRRLMWWAYAPFLQLVLVFYYPF